MSLSKVIETARADLGYTEDPPGSNRTKYWEAYDPKMQGQPWCVCFLWWVFQQAGERMAFFGGGKTASCSMLLRWYREQGLTVPVQQAQPGDIAIYNFSGTIEPEHCGLITEVKRAITTIASAKSIEGNTTASNGSESNGGCVAEKTRFTKNIVAVCRPQYKSDDPQPVDDVQAGDIVILNFHGTKDTEHCGLVVETYGDAIFVIEGNTSPGLEGSQNNGGCVALKQRNPSQIVAVCRPQYKSDDPQPVDDVTGHWFSPAVEWAREKGLIKNYPDGSFKPNNPLTRAEACAMFERFYQLLWEDDMR